MNNSEYKSNKVTLNDIVKNHIFFNVPIYQRLYVWKQEQIRTLLEDLYNAFSTHETNYFLGGVMTVRNKDLVDLVDGQQRFTTLWLICNVIKFVLKEETPETICAFCEKSGRKRIQFSIRPKITEFIMNLNIQADEDTEYKNIPDIKNMISAIGDIRSFMEDHKRQDHIVGFANFIATKVVLVRTEIPENADLNKIFELINGRGQQLSQTDILKSRILDLIRNTIPDDSDKLIRVSQIWDSCSDMSGYIESNIYRQDPKLTWKDLLIKKEDVEDSNSNLIDFGNDFFENYIESNIFKETEDSEISTDLMSLLLNDNKELSSEGDNQLDNTEEVVRSIVSFPMLLLYTLRVFLLEKELHIYEGCDRTDIETFNEKKLLLTFKPFVGWLRNHEEAAVEFINLLWRFRVAFDKYVVKFVTTEDSTDPILAIKKPRIYKNDRSGTLSVSRSSIESINDMSQLQAMLYFSQPRIYEHWICPFIFHTFKEDDEKNLLIYLQQLDNNLLCLPHEEDMIVRTYNVMRDGLNVNKPECYEKYFEQRISENKGCGFAHYLFYKMEYMLWKINTKDKEERWKGYRLTSKNSVEHISPQTPKFYKEKISNCDGFGNLALISSLDNSSYNNKSFKEKNAAYMDKRNNGTIDSLKSDMIYKYNNSWGEAESKLHFNSMVDVVRKYFRQTYQEYIATQSDENRFRKWLERNYECNKQTLLQAVFNEDPEPNWWNFPSLATLKNMEQTMRVFINNESLNIQPKNKEEFEHFLNYYLANYPQAIKLSTEDRYKVKSNEEIPNIILLNGTREGLYNYQELLMVITTHFLEQQKIKTEHYTYNQDFRTIHLYLQNNSITKHVDCDKEYENLYLEIWFDYNNYQMNYQLNFRKLNHPNIFSKKMAKYGWEKNGGGKFLFIEGKTYLYHFTNDTDYEHIAEVSVKKITGILMQLVSIDLT